MTIDNISTWQYRRLRSTHNSSSDLTSTLWDYSYSFDSDNPLYTKLWHNPVAAPRSAICNIDGDFDGAWFFLVNTQNNVEASAFILIMVPPPPPPSAAAAFSLGIFMLFVVDAGHMGRHCCTPVIIIHCLLPSSSKFDELLFFSRDTQFLIFGMVHCISILK